MMDESISTTQEIKTQQHRNLLIVSGVAVIVGFALYYFMGSGSINKSDRKKSGEASFSHPVEQMNTQSLWIERAQNKLKEQERKMAELKNEITQIKNSDNQTSIENDPRYQSLQKQNLLFQKALKLKENAQGEFIQESNDNNGQVFSTTPGARVKSSLSDERSVGGSDSIGIDNDVLNLKSITNVPQKNPNSYVPAGAFAEAIMLGAADASAGVQSQANPSPMLFRIVANGTLPNHQESHLKDCVVTAAVVGDISSERGQIRSERMSCTFSNGEIVEQPVEATIFGMDAKNGVRGTPVWREGALLGRAAVAGTLSGLGSAVSQTYTTNSISPLGSTQTVNNGDIFKYGAAQGVSSAMEKLAEYNIRRAEQYHPIIQLTAGQPVDIVFLKGFYLDGRKHEAKEEDKTASTELFPSSNQTPTGLTLSERELEKIKRNEQNMGWVSRGLSPQSLSGNQSGGMQ